MINILCIDNSETIRKVVKDCVLDLNYGFFEAANGKEGINLANKIDNIGMIILDWKMPIMSGPATLKKFRSIERFKDIFILILIKIENKDQVIDAIEMGANNYIFKPFNVNKLQKKIDELMKNAD